LSACKTADGIREICDISDDAAYRRLDELKRLPYGSYEIEEVLCRNFFTYIRKTNNPEFAGFRPSLSGLSEKYEDYAEYEHWAYVIDCIGGKEQNARLGAALANSIGVFNEGDLLIVTENEANKAQATRSLT